MSRAVFFFNIHHMILAVVLFVAVLLFPHDSFAWGPITHVDYAFEAMQHLSTYGSLVKTLLTQFPHDFLYGNLAADITLGKDYVDYVHNCHNWSVGFQIFNESKKKDDMRQQSAALGYLTHLAVDTISHNYFVPYTTIRSYTTRTLGHVYWEMRFDSRRPAKMWNIAKQIGKMDFRHNDDLFERMLRRTIFSFRTNRRIFRSVLTLHRLKHWKTMMEKVHGVSRHILTEKDIEDFRGLALASVIRFLREMEEAPCVRVDPTGAEKIVYADQMRKDLRKLFLKKKLPHDQAHDFLMKVRHALRDGIYNKVALPQIDDLMVP